MFICPFNVATPPEEDFPHKYFLIILRLYKILRATDSFDLQLRPVKMLTQASSAPKVCSDPAVQKRTDTFCCPEQLTFILQYKETSRRRRHRKGDERRKLHLWETSSNVGSEIKR